MMRIWIGRIMKIIKVPVLFIAGLLILEAFLRIFGFAIEPEYFLRDATPAQGRNYEPRNPYIDTTFSESTFNILVFGDSWSFGLGCNRDQTFPAVIERKLLKERHLAVRVANLSQPDYTSEDIAKIFPRSLNRFKADLAIVLAGQADSIPENLAGDYYARKPFSMGEKKWLDRWRVPRLASNIALASKLNGRNIGTETGKDRNVRKRTIEQTQSAFLTIGKAAGEAGVRLILVTYPKLIKPGWLHPHYPVFTERNLFIRSAADNFGVGLLDLEKIIPQEKTPQYLLPWLRWPHLSAEGHELAAKYLLEMIEPMLGEVPQI
jgi:hypothetical protein